MKNNAIAITIYLAGGSENARQSADAKVEPRINMTLKKGFSIVWVSIAILRVNMVVNTHVF